MFLAIVAHLIEKVEHAVSLQLTLPHPMGHSLGTARKYSDNHFACDDWTMAFEDDLDACIPCFFHVELICCRLWRRLVDV
jgi:hypothetical protein